MTNIATSFANLTPNTLHIWSLNFVVNDNAFNKYHNLLSDDEKERASRFKFFKDKRCYVVTKGILRLLSGQYLNKDAKAIKFEYEKYGKPKFKHKTNLNFNVSHSGDLAIIGFIYDHTIGVDIEKIKNDFDTFDIASKFFSKQEINALREIPTQQQHLAFYRCWTRKEAFIKAKGSGLSFPLNEFSVSLDSDLDAEVLWTKWNTGEKHQWKLSSFIPSKDYIAAHIVDSKIENIQYFNWADSID
ncbi:4'-phosphopantetheinyl transferase superfamily protein [uncultured Winogradskyella sp.]|uniref:4'-phosphopantetheinyl transferase family protein n=1 Tax=uncultured Winogradskyella sp. TaxID=395353 RepID=UPI00263514E9|nr:4'-phosphopantetheinyl transferase superfamily protein [uncultured Winogradskyella sp.]